MSHEQDVRIQGQGSNEQRPMSALEDGQQQPDPLDRLDSAIARLGRLCPELPLWAIQWMTIKHPLLPIHESWLKEVRGLSRCSSRWAVVAGRRIPWRQQLTEQMRWFLMLGVHGGRCLLHAVFLTALLGWLRWHLRRSRKHLVRQRFDLVAKSWGAETTRPINAEDFYFGDLQRRLARHQQSLLLLCGDIRGPLFDPRRWRVFADAYTRTEVLPQLPEWSLVSPVAPLHMAFQQIRTHVRLRNLSRRIRHPLLRQLSHASCWDCLSVQTTRNGLQFWVGHAVSRLWRPRALLTLYEGNSWERCLWWGAKTAHPSCLSVGYQHTILMPYNRALLRSSFHDRGYAKPDIVLCVGPRTHTWLEASHAGRALISFGTFRQVPEQESRYPPRPALRAVLVVPEGTLREATLLFNTACAAAVACPEYRFIFRCHPSLPFDHVRPYLRSGLEHIPNIDISSHPIAADFIRSSVVLYRGSSAVLYAILYGLKPVYVHDESFQDVDPLFELRAWREWATSTTLPTVLRQYAQERSELAVKSWRAAAEYVGTYTLAVEDAAIRQFVQTLSFSNASRRQ